MSDYGDRLIPRYMPVLGRYGHLDPSDGACLMEYVAVLAGEPFSDAPACTHPVLATVARLVNDTTSDTARQRLVLFAPDLASASSGNTDADLLVDPAIVVAAVHAAAGTVPAAVPDRGLLRHAHCAARRCRRLTRRPGAAGSALARVCLRSVALAWRRGPAMRALTAALAAVSRLPVLDRDIALRAMLTAAIDTWHTHHPPTHRRPSMTTAGSSPQDSSRTAGLGLLREDTVLDHAAADLAARFVDRFSPETVREIVHECHALLAANARVHTHLPVLATRFAAQRLEATAKNQGMLTRPIPEVLFICVHNAGRSQMAAALLAHHAQGRVKVGSAGSTPAHAVDPTVADALSEAGVHLAEAFPKPLTPEVVQAADIVVTMGCGDACPVYQDVQYLNWDLPDPAGQPTDVVQAIRDDIDHRVRALLDDITANVHAPIRNGDAP